MAMDELRERLVGHLHDQADYIEWGGVVDAILAEIAAAGYVVVKADRLERLRVRADWWCAEAWGHLPVWEDRLAECGLEPGDLASIPEAGGMTSAATHYDRQQTEQEFLQAVRHYARLVGWRTYHTLRSRGSEPGYPDLCMVREGRIIFAELKAERGRVSPAQLDWLDALKHSGLVEVYVWRPSNWRHIEEVLR